MTIPSISIIVCSYNHSKWIARCLRSILNQKKLNGNDFEIILINDASTDDTLNVLNSFQNIDNLKIFSNNKNIGLPKSLNKAIKISRGRYIVRVDSDDYISDNFLFFMKTFMDFNRHYEAIACDYKKIDENENEISRHNSIEEEIACGVMFRKETLIDLGLYNEKYKMREGHELRAKFLARKKLIGRLELPFYKYRQHDKNRTKNKKILKNYDEKLKNIIYS